MKLGLFAINFGPFATEPELAVAAARVAEAAGWESVWTGEHFGLPDPATPDSPTHPRTPMLEPFVALTNIAAQTSTLLLGTGVTVLPLYNPYALAKLVVSLDRISDGRMLFGVGAGYLEAEFDAFDVALSTRGAATDDMLDALTAIWTSEAPTLRWRGRTRAGLRAEPRPLRAAGPPLHVGGAGPAAFRRAVERGAGWFGWAHDPSSARSVLARLALQQDRRRRPEDLGRLEISISPPAGLDVDAAVIDAYRELGVDRLILLPPASAREPEAMADYLRRMPELTGGGPA